MLSSNISSTGPYNMVNFGVLAAEIDPVVWGTAYEFQRVSRLGSVTARHSSIGRQPNFAALKEGAICIRQGGHHVGHWPTFLVLVSTRSTGTVHASAKARLTRIRIQIRNPKFNLLFIGSLPTFSENFMQIRLEFFCAKLLTDRQTNRQTTTIA